MTGRPLTLQGQPPEPVARVPAPLAKGFRPFFLLAAMFAVTVVPLWIGVITGGVRPTTYLDAISWHAHEMIFGFAVAVFAGFLLTAVGNWTGRETAVGARLALLAGAWTAGRVAMIFADALPPVLVAAVDLAFLPALAFTLARPLVATGNRRNFVMIAILGALFVADVVVHLDAIGALPVDAARRACLVATDVVVFAILVMAGRVFPMFTRNATGAATITSSPRLEQLTIASMAALVALELFVPGRPSALAAGMVGVVAVARAARWGTRHTARHPLLWILHVGYGWLALGLLLRAAVALGLPVPESLATHALTVGAIGSITLGMMARVALGHTGRTLVAPRPAVWAFAAMTLAAVARVLLPMFAPAHYLQALELAAALWTLSFVLFLSAYVPLLLAPRVDGKAG